MGEMGMEPRGDAGTAARWVGTLSVMGGSLLTFGAICVTLETAGSNARGEYILVMNLSAPFVVTAQNMNFTQPTQHPTQAPPG